MTSVKLLPLLSLIAVTYLASASYAADGLVFSSLGLTPQSRAVPGNTVVLEALIANSSTDSATGTIVATIPGLPYLQCARTVHLEAGQQRALELYIQLPDEIADLELFQRLDVSATLYVRDGEREVIQLRDGQPATRTLSMTVMPKGRVIGMQAAPEPPKVLYWDWPQPVLPSDYEFVTAARVDAMRDRKSISFEDRPLPLQMMQWDALDLFAIADPAALQDPAAIDAMQRFIQRGGRVWIMLDQVAAELIQPLLGPDQSVVEVERVMLDQFRVEVASAAGRFSDEALPREMAMARVVQSGGDVQHHIDGWPASIVLPIGYGQLLLTTIDGAAWIEPRAEQRSSDPYYQSDFTVRPWGTNWGLETNTVFPELPISSDVDYPLLLIGNPVVPRGMVATALLGFCAVLAIAGAGLAAIRQQVWIGWLAPALAVLASLTLLLAATWMRRDMLESVARLQLIDIGDDGRTGLIREQTAVYLDRLSDMQLDSQIDGNMRTSDAITSGVRRFNTEDFEKWNMANEAWPPGSWRYQAKFAMPVDELSVRGHLTAAGLQLEMPAGLPAPLADPILSFVPGDPLLCRASGKEITVDPRLTVSNGRWIADSILSAEQQRRMDVYQEFFLPQADLQRPARRLYGWTAPWPTSQWSREMQQPGAALVALPVSLQRPEVGQEIYIPHGLIALQQGLDALGTTTTYDEQTGQWRPDLLVTANAELDFVLPSEVIPFAATSLALELDILAPERIVTLSARGPAGPIQLARLDSPSLPWTGTITDANVLQLAADGRLEILLQVSQRQAEAEADIGSSYVTWQVAHFHASLRGSVLAQSSLSQNQPIVTSPTH